MKSFQELKAENTAKTEKTNFTGLITDLQKAYLSLEKNSPLKKDLDKWATSTGGLVGQ